jgi:hypothetical protein
VFSRLRGGDFGAQNVDKNVVKCVANVDRKLSLSAGGAREQKEANATAGPSTALLTKCREQLRSG